MAYFNFRLSFAISSRSLIAVSKSNDLEVNPTKAKQLTNIRAAGKDEAIDLIPPRKMSLEQALSYIQADELLEVTPKSLRLRKKILDPILRKRSRME